MMTKNKFNLFLLTQLPIAFIAGVRLEESTLTHSVTRVKLSRFSQNPFKSMFWAVQGMAAELSTGLLCILHIQQTGAKVSMLVVEQKAVFVKKAVGRIRFECAQGDEIKRTIERAVKSGEGETLQVVSIGKDEQGDIVSEFTFTWSFKKKN